MRKAEDDLASWLSAALEDPNSCDEFKQVINNWFDMINKRDERIKVIGVFAENWESKALDNHRQDIEENSK